jgi:hypothetical protein
MKKVLGLLVMLFMIGCQPLPPENNIVKNLFKTISKS